VSAVIELREVALTYSGPPAFEALHPASLVVGAGEHVSIVGPSGSGKSTLMNILGLLDRPTAGTYLLDSVDTVALSNRDRAGLRGRRIGFVFQAFHLLPHRTARENVALALLYSERRRSVRETEADSALDRVGLSHRKDALPTTLSGGERQRVAIARSLLGSPSLLLCDEPTGNLDSANASGVLRLLDELCASGLTIMVVTHDAAVANRGDRIVEIKDGHLRESIPA
jgi:putative ABC transport system ATP-binding protein